MRTAPARWSGARWATRPTRAGTWPSRSAATWPSRAGRSAHRHLEAALARVRLVVPDRRRHGQRRLRRGAAGSAAQPRVPAGPAGRLLPEIDIADVDRPARSPPAVVDPRPRHGAGRVLLAGDALSLINPFTGEGIFYAVLSGSLAGHAAAVAPARAAAAVRGRAAPPTRPAPAAQRRGGVAGPHAGGDRRRGPGRRQRPHGLRLDRRARARRRSVSSSARSDASPRELTVRTNSSSVRPWRRSLVCK